MMLRTLLILLLCWFSFSTFGQEITVATFNAEFLNSRRVHIKFGLPFDLKDEPKKVQKFWADNENRSSKLREASSEVAQLIKQMNADIMTLTEVGDEGDIQVLLEELSKLGTEYDHYVVCDCKDTFTGQHVAVLSRYPLKDVWQNIPGRSIYLEELDGDAEGETGISKGLKVTAIIDDTEIDVFVLHLKSERGGYDSDAKRLAQATIARRAIIKQLNLGRKVIVTGDLNAEKGSPSLYRIRGFDDTYEELIQTGRSEYFESNEVRWTYTYQGEPDQIDHILISSGLASRKGIKTKIIEVKDELVSDHNPVVVKLNLLQLSSN